MTAVKSGLHVNRCTCMHGGWVDSRYCIIAEQTAIAIAKVQLPAGVLHTRLGQAIKWAFVDPHFGTSCFSNKRPTSSFKHHASLICHYQPLPSWQFSTNTTDCHYLHIAQRYPKSRSVDVNNRQHDGIPSKHRPASGWPGAVAAASAEAGSDSPVSDQQVSS